MKRRVIIGATTAAVLIIALCASTFLIAYTDSAFICENTGSRMGYREWPLGIRTNEWYRESKLENYIKNSHAEMLQHRWTSYAGRGSSLVPALVCNGHGRPGPIYFIRPETFDAQVDASSDQERVAIYQALSSGNRDLCKSVVDGMVEQAESGPRD